MNIATIGCTHGNLDYLFNEVLAFEEETGKKIDLVIACGDVQTIRNETDIPFLSIKPKYKKGLCGDFHKYFNKKKTVPKPMVFIGGNHEASSCLRENMLGGYLAENIYFLGYSGVLDITKGDFKLRILGTSGIFKFFDFNKEYSQILNGDTYKGEYHIKDVDFLKILLFDFFTKTKKKLVSKELKYFLGVKLNEPETEETSPPNKLTLLSENIFTKCKKSRTVSLCLTHDWPSLIFQGPQKNKILKDKKYFSDDIEKNFIGNKGGDIMITLMEPNIYFSGHYHYYLESCLNHNSMNKKNLLKVNNMNELVTLK
jgi:lariat debranching enzyme